MTEGLRGTGAQTWDDPSEQLLPLPFSPQVLCLSCPQRCTVLHIQPSDGQGLCSCGAFIPVGGYQSEFKGVACQGAEVFQIINAVKMIPHRDMMEAAGAERGCCGPETGIWGRERRSG